MGLFDSLSLPLSLSLSRSFSLSLCLSHSLSFSLCLSLSLSLSIYIYIYIYMVEWMDLPRIYNKTSSYKRGIPVIKVSPLFHVDVSTDESLSCRRQETMRAPI